MVTPVLIPNTEVKLLTLMAVVSYKTPNHQAVLLYFQMGLNRALGEYFFGSGSQIKIKGIRAGYEEFGSDPGKFNADLDKVSRGIRRDKIFSNTFALIGTGLTAWGIYKNIPMMHVGASISFSIGEFARISQHFWERKPEIDRSRKILGSKMESYVTKQIEDSKDPWMVVVQTRDGPIEDNYLRNLDWWKRY